MPLLGRYAPTLLFLALAAIAAVLIYAVVRDERSGVLTVAFLDVGQGDAIYIESPTGVEVVIDGGPDASVVRELGELMPFYDRSLDLLIVTNPDQDHFAGFIDVLERFEVARVMEPGVQKDSAVYERLQQEIAEEEAERFIAKRGMVLDLGGGVEIRILFPDRDISGVDTNPGSIVAQLIYGETEVLLMGDSVKAVEEFLVALDGERLRSDILKVGHHGSRTSTSDSLLSAVRPRFAIISAGKDNRYGHPHREVVESLQRFAIEALRTDEEGTVIFESDGRSLLRR